MRGFESRRPHSSNVSDRTLLATKLTPVIGTEMMERRPVGLAHQTKPDTTVSVCLILALSSLSPIYPETQVLHSPHPGGSHLRARLGGRGHRVEYAIGFQIAGAV